MSVCVCVRVWFGPIDWAAAVVCVVWGGKGVIVHGRDVKSVAGAVFVGGVRSYVCLLLVGQWAVCGGGRMRVPDYNAQRGSRRGLVVGCARRR